MSFFPGSKRWCHIHAKQLEKRLSKMRAFSNRKETIISRKYSFPNFILNLIYLSGTFTERHISVYKRVQVSYHSTTSLITLKSQLISKIKCKVNEKFQSYREQQARHVLAVWVTHNELEMCGKAGSLARSTASCLSLHTT